MNSIHVFLAQLKPMVLANMKPIREVVCVIFGAIGSGIIYLLGGWTEAMTTLAILMAIDYFTGMAVAAIFKNSSKTKHGGLKSTVGFKGLVKKFVEVLIVGAMHWIDIALGIDYLRDLCIIGFALNELISITENAGLMGIPLPPVITKAIEILNTKSEGGGE